MTDANGYPLDANGNWLECLPFTGQEASLPTGYTVKVPGLDVMQFIKNVEIMDAETDEGFRTVKKSEVKPGDIVIGVNLNENSVQKVVQTYGGDWIRMKDANGASYNRMDWRTKYGTDGLELLAIRNLRGSVSGTKPATQSVSSADVMPKKPPSPPVYKI